MAGWRVGVGVDAPVGQPCPLLKPPGFAQPGPPRLESGRVLLLAVIPEHPHVRIVVKRRDMKHERI